MLAILDQQNDGLSAGLAIIALTRKIPCFDAIAASDRDSGRRPHVAGGGGYRSLYEVAANDGSSNVRSIYLCVSMYNV